MQPLRDDKLQVVADHLIGLMRGNAGLQRQQILAVDPRGLGQHLPPAVLQCGLDAQHGQPAGVEGGIGILGGAGEQKIRFRIALGPGTARMPYAQRGKQFLDMVFQRKAHAALAAVLHRQRKLQEAVDIRGAIGEETGLKPRGNDMPLQTPEQRLLEFDPCQKGGIRPITRIDAGQVLAGQRRKGTRGRELRAEAANDFVQPVGLGFFGLDADLFKDIIADEIQSAVTGPLEALIAV